MDAEYDDVGFQLYLAIKGYAQNLTEQDYQFYCETLMINKTTALERANVTFCPSVYDGYYCWAPTKMNSRPSRKCPVETNSNDPAQLAYRHCQENGVWGNKTDYDMCMRSDTILQAIFVTGFTLSFISLLLSLGIFLYFKNLRCLRNHIHSNLIFSFLIRSVAYFALYAYTMNFEGHNVVCNILHAITNFAMLANHIWMVMEGLYLFLIILCTFSIEKLKFWHFGLMGWGLTGLLTGTYCIVMVAYYPNRCWNEGSSSAISWILNGPIIGSLVVNTLFLIFILYSLVIKVKASQRYRPTAVPTTTGEATLATEYRKALKAMLVLFPLLGIYYILFLIPPHHAPELMKIYGYIHALMLSTQGFFVALIYCFLNSEVRSVIHTHYSHWGQSRSLFRHRQCSLGAGGLSLQNRRNSRSANFFLSADHRSHSLVSGRSVGAQSYNGTNDTLLAKPTGRRQRLSGPCVDPGPDGSDEEQQETALYLAVPPAGGAGGPDQPNGRSVPSDPGQTGSLRRNGAAE